jgi:GTP-binding protein
VVIIGRSNVGKSSLINTICRRKNLAKTSSSPGKTRLINYFLIDNKLFLVDLPGYGYVKHRDSLSLKWDDLLGDFLLKNKHIKLVLVLIDSRHPELEADKYTINWLQMNNIPFAIILTKRDKLTHNEFNRVWQIINSNYPETIIVPFSIKDQSGRENIIELLIDAAANGRPG